MLPKLSKFSHHLGMIWEKKMVHRIIINGFCGIHDHHINQPSVSFDGTDEEEETLPCFSPKSMDNPAFEKYLKAQRLVKDEDEWQQLIETLKSPLPVTIRVNKDPFNQYLLLKHFIETRGEKEWFVDDPDTNRCHLKTIEWYPEGLTFNFDRPAPINLPVFGFFAKSEKSSGGIYFQEAVSMIPILVLNAQPGQRLLDMCASPGSKTTQVLQQLTSQFSTSWNAGSVVANDVEMSRCIKILTHAKLTCYPQLITTKGNAGNFPPLQNDHSDEFYLKFDRVLCDVPCTGDGTLRKNPQIWDIWDPISFQRYHCLQKNIAYRGASHLTKGGLMVYSTCTFNPVENEAVVADLIRSSKGSLELVDLHDGRLEPLKSIPGLKRWSVMQPDGHLVSSYKESTDTQSLVETMFPLEENEMEKIGIDRCLRILPHHQNTGGFFVALIKKNDSVPWESTLPYRRQKVHQSVGIKFLDDEDDKDWLEIKTTYRLKENFPHGQLLHHSTSQSHKKIHFVTKDSKELITSNRDKLNFVRCGVGLFERLTIERETRFRLLSEGLPIILPFLPEDLIVDVDFERFKAMLVDTNEFETVLIKELKDSPTGCYVVRCVLKKSPSGSQIDITLAIPVMRLAGKVFSLISKLEKIHYMRICGLLNNG